MSIITLIDTGVLGGYETHMDNPVDVLIDGFWYRGKVRNLPDVEHLLSVHPIYSVTTQAKKYRKFPLGARVINQPFDTGLCGDAALADDICLAREALAGCGLRLQPPDHATATVTLRWNPQLGNDGARLFFGGFEIME